jgi:magnesium transporter
MDIDHSIAVEFDLEARKHRVVPIDQLVIDKHNKHKIYWVHSNLNNLEEHKRITSLLSLPADVTSLCQQQDTMPFLSDTDDSATLQIQCVRLHDLDNLKTITFDTLTLYLTPTFCFTASHQPLAVLSQFNDSYDKSLRYAKTSCFILFLLLDYTVNDYAQMLFHYELLGDKLQSKVHAQHKNMYDKIMRTKQHIIQLKRNAVGAREIVARLSGHQISVISEQCRASLINLSNHNNMVVYEADSIQDMLNGYLDQLENALMHKLSETMKILTIFSAIFLPLTLIAGIYGMNFQHIPELSWKYGYFYALGLIGFCAILLIIIFKKMKWF